MTLPVYVTMTGFADDVLMINGQVVDAGQTTDYFGGCAVGAGNYSFVLYDLSFTIGSGDTITGNSGYSYNICFSQCIPETSPTPTATNTLTPTPTLTPTTTTTLTTTQTPTTTTTSSETPTPTKSATPTTTASLTATPTVTPTMTPTSPVAPGPVTILAANSGPETGEILITWAEPDNGGSPILQYSIAYQRPGSLSVRAVSGSLTSFTLSNLLEGYEYTLNISATNAVGTGPYGPSIIVIL